jgi:plasmid maintenance system antidote protein VapI
MSRMHNPTHPGEVFGEWLTEGMALCFSVSLSISPDVWLGMQTQWDLWQAEKPQRPTIRPLDRQVA